MALGLGTGWLGSERAAAGAGRGGVRRSVPVDAMACNETIGEELQFRAVGPGVLLELALHEDVVDGVTIRGAEAEQRLGANELGEVHGANRPQPSPLAP